MSPSPSSIPNGPSVAVDLQAPSRIRDALPAFLLASAIVIVTYVWFVSVGYWTWWPKTTYTYDLLGSAFRSGQLSLQDAPDPALLALSNPYDPGARSGMQYPWDASLYNGRYYLYWGPTPAVFLAIIKLFYGRQIADQYLVFAFILGTYIFGALLLIALWRRYFTRIVPVSILFVSLLAFGLVGPSTWLLNRPAGYEAAISGGQLLFAAGLYFGVTAALSESPSRARLSLAGIAWALAIGSRVSTILPIALMGLVLLAMLVRSGRGVSSAIGAVAAFMIPLILGGAVLGWYNWVRFGSPTEFGLRYQLTLIDFRAAYSRAFSIGYVPANLYNYVLNPFAIDRVFPFLVPLLPGRLPMGPALSIPTANLEAVTGIIVYAPFLVYSILPIGAFLMGSQRANSREAGATPRPEGRWLLWLYVGLSLSALLAFVFILMYFYPTMRQLEDVVPITAILAVLGLWEGWRFLRGNSVGLAALTAVGLVLIVFSIIASSLLAVTSYDSRFQHLNRELLRELIRFFGR